MLKSLQYTLVTVLLAQLSLRAYCLHCGHRGSRAVLVTAVISDHNLAKSNHTLSQKYYSCFSYASELNRDHLIGIGRLAESFKSIE
jgi:hypothetical protein